MTIGALIKPIDELTADDIQDLVDEQIEEGESVEFKEGLSSSGNLDQVTSKVRITNEDKAKILKEIVAFANGYGGRLFVGISEDAGNLGIAGGVVPIPGCADLADRLGRICGDLIDPPMLRLDVAGIPTEDDSSGVIVFDVPASIRAPHMSKRDSRSYRRRGSESVPMDMRDIQDMTLRSASRFSEIETEFSIRQKKFDDMTQVFEVGNKWGFCFRLSYVALEDVDLGHVHRVKAVAPEFSNYPAHYQNEPEPNFRLQFPGGSLDNRPVMRGTKFHSYMPASSDAVPAWEYTLWSNGGMEIWYAGAIRYGPHSSIYLGELAYWLSNGLRNVERVRLHAGLASLSYGIEAQLKVIGEPAVLLGIPVPRSIFDPEFLKCGVHPYPRYTVGSKDRFDETVNLFVNDCLNDAGIDRIDELVVDYQLG